MNLEPMRRVPESEIESEFERQICWGDDERHFYNPNRRKASVFSYFLRLEEVLDLVDRFSPGKRVADMACAQGNFGLLLAERGYEVTAVDINPEFLKYAKKKYTGGSFQTVQANLIEFRDPKGFDCILLGEIIEHVAFPEALLRAAFENLKPGGICIVTTPNGEDFGSTLPTFKQVENLETLIPRQFHWGDHLFLYSLGELFELFQKTGLKPIFSEKYHSFFVSQLKGIRYVLPLAFLKWCERFTRHWKKRGRDSANMLIVVGKKNVS